MKDLLTLHNKDKTSKKSKTVSRLTRRKAILEYLWKHRGKDLKPTPEIFDYFLSAGIVSEKGKKTIEDDLRALEGEGSVKHEELGRENHWGYDSELKYDFLDIAKLPEEIRAVLLLVKEHFSDSIPLSGALDEYMSGAKSIESVMNSKSLKDWKNKVSYHIPPYETQSPTAISKDAEYKIYEALFKDFTFDAIYHVSLFDLDWQSKWKEIANDKDTNDSTSETRTYHPIGLVISGRYKFLIAKTIVRDVLSIYRFAIHKFSNVEINSQKVNVTDDERKEYKESYDTDPLVFTRKKENITQLPYDGEETTVKLYVVDNLALYFEETNNAFGLKSCKGFPHAGSRSNSGSTHRGGWRCVEGKVKITKEFKRWLMSLFLGIEIIEPSELRDEFKDYIETASKFYDEDV